MIGNQRFFFAFLVFLWVGSIPTQAQNLPKQLEQQLLRQTKIEGGTIGFSAMHIESGKRISFNGQKRFPMASVFKLPIALQILHKVDQGELSLEKEVPIGISDLRTGYSPLAEKFPKAGISLKMKELLEAMLLTSDNTACDLLLKMAGGPEAVTSQLAVWGFKDLRVDRSEAQIGADYSGIDKLPPEDEWSPQMFRKLYKQVPPDKVKAAEIRFESDPRDSASADAMLDLLIRVHYQNLLKPDSSALLVDLLRRCQTGEGRLKGLLPKGTEVAHKTGTIGNFTNDVGIITLPNDGGHIAIAVFVKSSTRDNLERERAIAELARTVYDYFSVQENPGSTK